MNCLCMLVFKFGQVYSDVVVVVMHDVMVCVVYMVIDHWTLARMMVIWLYAYVLYFYMLS